MWLSEAAVNRIRELESQLQDSVPKAVYDAALARIAEQERRIDWQSDMLLRASHSLPLPPVREVEKVEPPPRISDSDRAKAEAVIAHGRSINASQQEIADAVRGTVAGWTEAEISAAINAPSNGHG